MVVFRHRHHGDRHDCPTQSQDCRIRTLDAVKAQAFVEGWRDVQLLATKLEDLVFLAHRYHYDVPMELLLTVSMAVEFLGTLITQPSVEQRSADLPAFIDQVDAVLRETAALAPTTDRSPPPPAAAMTPAPISLAYKGHCSCSNPM